MVAAVASAFCLLTLPLVAAAASPPGEGPAAHWTFDELSPDGKSVPDVSGGKHPGRLAGPSVLVEGKLGKALKLAGPPEQVSVGELGVRAPATVAFWFNTRELFSDRIILSQVTGPEDAAGALRFDGGQIEVFDGQAWRLLVKWGLRFDTWQHVAVVFDPQGNAIGYLDGQPQETVKSGFDFAGAEAGIAAKRLGKTGNPFIGRLDDFRIYSRALSAEDIQRFCAAGK
jgi:hypothetical protein